MPGPDFLDLPARTTKPRRAGITHVLDAGLPMNETVGLLEACGRYVLETLRLSLRADTYRVPSPVPAAACGT
jgi:phosphosulfolactate synthase (CoM biosynthesis protein A)